MKNILVVGEDERTLEDPYREAFTRFWPECQMVFCSSLNALHEKLKEHQSNTAAVIIDAMWGYDIPILYEGLDTAVAIRTGRFGGELQNVPILVTSGDMLNIPKYEPAIELISKPTRAEKFRQFFVRHNLIPETPTQETQTALKKKTIIALDDDASNKRRPYGTEIARLLPDSSFIFCRNPKDFYEALETSGANIAAIILDTRLPVRPPRDPAREGITIAKEIRAGNYGEPFRNVPILLTSGDMQHLPELTPPIDTAFIDLASNYFEEFFGKHGLIAKKQRQDSRTRNTTITPQAICDHNAKVLLKLLAPGESSSENF